MANEEQLKILKRGTKKWNRWREKHPDKEIDLRGANLKEVSLSGANLEFANLERGHLSGNLFEVNLFKANLEFANLSEVTDMSYAKLSRAKLFGADLRHGYMHRTDLSEADLSEADLSEAHLVEANLNKANLKKANLSGAKLYNANISGASLIETNLSEAYLEKVNLIWADLKGANLSKANLVRADLRLADLSKALLSEANLGGADFSRANLSKANLHMASLSWTSLNRTNLTNATITGVKLYGTARDDWKIDGIICDYVFWSSHRTPKDRNFRPGEFEELYKQLPTFEYVFKHGFTALDAVVMSRIVKAINEQHPEFELNLDSFHSRGQPHAKFTVLHKEYVEDARHKIKDGYESRMKALEGRIDQMERFFSAFLEQPKVQQDVFINQLAIAEKGELTMGEKHIGRDNIEISGNAQVTNLTTGASFQGDYAQLLLQSTTPLSSQEDIVKLLSFVQQELPKLPLPDDVKKEIANEVEGAEIQAKKEEPDKKNIGEKLQNATEALEKVPKLTKAAVTVGNLLGQAILWCGMKWVEWKYGG